MMRGSEQRLEAASHNIANITTPGYKSGDSFESAITGAEPQATTSSSVTIHPNFAQGGLRQTGRSLDLAISGAGFFKLRSGNQIYYSRDGQFERAADGRIVTAQGLA